MFLTIALASLISLMFSVMTFAAIRAIRNEDVNRETLKMRYRTF